MALSLAQMITEVQDLTQRGGDTALITAARVTLWLNEAQRYIVEHTPGLIDLETKDTTSLDTATNTLSYSFANFSPRVCHLLNVYYIDGTSSIKLIYKPYDEFDRRWPSPTSLSTTMPKWWTRRANTIELYPVPSSTYNGKDLRVDYTGYAADLSGTENDTGIATGTQTSTTLKDTNKTWTVDAQIGRYVHITGGTGSTVSDPMRLITDNDANTLTVAAWTTTPVAASSTYSIRTGLTESQIKNSDDGLITFGISRGYRAVGKHELSRLWWQEFLAWFDGFKIKNDRMLAWDGNVIFDEDDDIP